jgi:type II secretory pathway pseudopilin PulG
MKRLNAKKAFSTMELLLVIGLIAGSLAVMFKVYNNIKQSNVEQKFLTDLTQVIAGVNKYYDISEKFPTTGKLNLTSASAWNKTETYVPFNVANKWTLSKYTPSGGTPSVKVVPNTNTYGNINTDYKLETYNKKCEIGSLVAKGCILLVDKYDSTGK